MYDTDNLSTIKQRIASEVTVSEEQLDNTLILIGNAALPRIILELLRKELIDISRADDWVYLWVATLGNMAKVLPGLDYLLDISGEMIRDAEKAIENNHCFTSLILISTATEHAINLFLREYLSFKGMTKNEIKGVIGSNIPSKLGWIMKLADISIPQEITGKIKHMFRLRNLIVHYKAEPIIIDEDQPQILEKLDEIKDFDFNEILKQYRKLKLFLENEMANAEPLRRNLDEIIEYMMKVPES